MSQHLDSSLYVIDCHYQIPEKACSFLILENNHACFVDNNTRFAVPYLMDALKQQGLSPEQVDYLFVTHAHLDHAGGTAELLKHCPNAKVVAHPRTARHLAHPERLIEGARAVYGEPLFTQLYGEIEPVPEERIIVVEDNETLDWYSHRFQFLHTLGHAKHHMCIYNTKLRGIFTGDSFGLGRSHPDTFENEFSIVSTAPPDFDAVEAEKTIQRLLSFNPEYVFLPHYGIHRNPQLISTRLLRSLDAMKIIIQTAIEKNIPDENLMDWLFPRVMDATQAQLEWCGVKDIESALNWLGDDPKINTMGLMVAIQRMRKNT